jgi:hypothetical protein
VTAQFACSKLIHKDAAGGIGNCPSDSPKAGWGAMKWIIAFDQDDLTLAIAAFVSGVAISLAFL